MNTSRFTLSLAAIALAAFVATAGMARAAVDITPAHIQGTPAYAVQGTLQAVDVPTSELGNNVPITGPLGSDWTQDADDGFSILDGAVIYTEFTTVGNKPGWEPDGTSATGPRIAWMLNKPAKQMTWDFNLPDGAIIHNVYAAWGYQGNSGSGHTYTCDEGTLTTFTRAAAQSTGDLVLQWVDNAAAGHNVNFQRIFAGPFAVAGGDGFRVTFTQIQSGTYPYVDAVVVDYSPPSAAPPAIAVLSPADGTGNVPLRSDLVATFDKVVQLTGSGTVTIRNLTLGPGDDLTIPLPDAQVSVSGAQLTINPANPLNVATNYAVQISGDAVEDGDGRAFAGIADDTTWTFTTTADGTPPAIQSTDPADGATDVALTVNLLATFGEPVVLTGSGTVTIRNLTLGPGADLVISLPDPQVSVSGPQLIINPLPFLATSTGYAVQISDDALVDLNQNPFDGIADDSTWTFTSEPPKYTAGVEVTPDHIQGTPVYAVVDTLLAIDVPSSAVTGGVSGPGGPDWPDNSHDGFSLPAVANFMYNDDGRPGWEADGTDAKAAQISWMWNKPGQSVTYAFDLPDGSVVHHVWGTWHWQGNAGTGHTYTYDEGTPTTFTRTATSASTGDLVLRWTDSGGAPHDETFQRIFAGPIVVAGGDGFVVTFTQVPGGTFPYIDALVVDVTVPPDSADPDVSTILASPPSVPADGVSASTITVTLKTAAGTPVPARQVTLTNTAGPGMADISPAGPVTTDADGGAVFTVTSSHVGAEEFTAADTTAGAPPVTLNRTAVVSFSIVSQTSLIPGWTPLAPPAPGAPQTSLAATTAPPAAPDSPTVPVDASVAGEPAEVPVPGVIRVTEYYLTDGDFGGTEAPVTLHQALAADYFILVRGSRTGDGLSLPASDYARVVAVPGGRGGLADSGAADMIGLRRAAADEDWEGVVTVVECIDPGNPAGFRLVDAPVTLLSGTSGSQACAPWGDAGRVVPFGGYRGGGVELTGDAISRYQGTSAYLRLYPGSDGALHWQRDGGGETLLDAVVTTFVVEWGSGWTVQHTHVAGASGGDGADAPDEYTTAPINSVNRDNTWVWGTGIRADAGIGDCAESCLVALGDGANRNAIESVVAVGSEYTDAYSFDVYALTHPALAVDHRFKPDGDLSGTDITVGVAPALPGARFAWVYNGCNGTSSRFPRPRLWSRYTADDAVTVSRGYDGAEFPAWIQAIDFSGLGK